jgi:tetratricopeptide (TPR) repeat protein
MNEARIARVNAAADFCYHRPQMSHAVLDFSRSLSMKRSRKLAYVILLIVLSLFLVSWNSKQWRSERKLEFARRALRDRNVESALAAAEEAARLTPESGEVHLLLARLFRHQGLLDKVHDSLRQAAAFGVSRERIRREEWLALAQAGQMKEAQPHLSELLLDPGEDGPEICEAFANGYFLTYRLADAFQILDAWEKDFPQDAQPHAFRAAINGKMNSFPTAITHLRKAVLLAPSRIDLQIELASTLLLTRGMDEAAELLEQALHKQPENPQALLGWAQILLERDQKDQARSTLEHLVKLEPDNFVALRLLGEIHSSAERYSEALQLLEKSVAIKNNDPKARYALGTVLQRLGRRDEALQHFEFVTKNNEVGQRMQKLLERVRDNDSDVEARFEITELLRGTGESADRLLWLRSVVELDPTHQRAHAELADCYAALGNLEESRKHHRLAEAKEPQ